MTEFLKNKAHPRSDSNHNVILLKNFFFQYQKCSTLTKSILFLL